MSSLFTGIGAPGVIVTPSLRVVSVGLSRYAGDIRSLREPLETAVETVVRNRIDDNFRGETAALQENWASLSERTEQDREREGYGGQSPKLQRTGKMKREALQKNIWTFRGQEGLAFVTGSAFTAAPYAPLHQEGWATKTGSAPARPFLIINEDDVDKIEEIIREWLRMRARANGLDSGAYLHILSRAVV